LVRVLALVVALAWDRDSSGTGGAIVSDLA